MSDGNDESTMGRNITAARSRFANDCSSFHKLPMPRADELAYIVVRVLVKPTRTHTKTKTIVSVQQ